MTQETINKLPKILTQRINTVNDEMLEIMGKHIKEIGKLTKTDIHRLKQMRKTGADIRKINNRLAEITNKNIEDIEKIFKKVAEDNYNDTKVYHDFKEKPFIPFEKNSQLQAFIKSVERQAVADYINMSNTTVLSVLNRNGDIVNMPLEKAYKNVIDMAVHTVKTGHTDYKTAMRKTLKTFAENGIKTVSYESGYKRRLDSAVRMNILEGVRRLNQGIQDITGEKIGTDGVEISVHELPAPDHADIQGKQLTNEEYEKWNKAHEYPKRQIGKLNCHHFTFRIVMGIQKPRYSAEELKKIKERSNRKIEFDGKTYTMYEATQLQRKIETAVREKKSIANLAKASGDDELRREAQRKINILQAKYKKLSETARLSEHKDRMSVSGFRRVKASGISLTTEKENAIIKTENEFSEVRDVHYVGKIDKKIFECVTKDITTDEVVITNERINHIKEGHPEDYEKYCEYIAKMLKKPQYIFESDRKNTAFVMNTFVENGKNFELILRLKTSQDPENYKNSIITFMKISDRKRKKYLRNKKILYKSE